MYEIEDARPRALNFKDKTGERYGRLLVIKFVGIYRIGRSRKSVWLCKCNCGVEKEYLAGSLSTGRTKSCGCLSKETTAAFNIKTKTKTSYDTFSCVWQSYVQGAKKRSLEFALTKDEFYALSQKNCNYCGLEPKQIRSPRLKTKTANYIFNGIDRVDSAKGYIIENCVPCCKVCNRMKVDTPLGMWIDKMKTILDYLKLNDNLTF